VVELRAITDPAAPLDIRVDDPRRHDVLVLLQEHLSDMFATSPAESVHALDPDALAGPAITFLSARRNSALLGIGALKQLSPTLAEIKSMRTTAAARGTGVAGAIVRQLLRTAAGKGISRVSLETGTQDYFAAARRLYTGLGFTPCGPFGDYTDDPHSVFLTIETASGPR
jgi:putative acetyltransferase